MSERKPQNQKVELMRWLLVGALGFLLVATLSYHRTDNAYTYVTSVSVTQNVCGWVGALVADYNLSWFGFSAFIVPLVFILALVAGRFNLSAWGVGMRTMAALGLSCSLSALEASIAYKFNLTTTYLPMDLGGIIGKLLWQGLMRPLGSVGSFGILAGYAAIELNILLSDVNWHLEALLSVLKLVIRGAYAIFLAVKASMLKQLSVLKSSLASRTSVKESLAEPEEAAVLEEPDLTTNQVSLEELAAAIEVPETIKLDTSSVDSAIAAETLALETSEPETTKAPISETDSDEADEVLDDTAPFQLPSLDLLNRETLDAGSGGLRKKYNTQELTELSREVEQKLQDFGIKAKVVNALPGPVITRFELSLAAGTKASRITGLAKDLARSLSVFSVRVVEVIPGKSVIGLELPNPHREIVRLHELLTSQTFTDSRARLAIALGKSIAGEPVVVDLTKMPHLLVAGTTGSGKSVCINAMLLSLLYKYTPSELRLILIDPKMLELSVYDGIPHLLAPVVVDMKEVTALFSWCVAEMEHRYRLMAALGVRNLVGYNQQILDATNAGRKLQNPLWEGEGSLEPQFLAPLPYLIVMADEYADMMMVVGKKIEELIVRLAQKARAAGIHLILATQRPSVDVVTGLIKANIPTRIAFQVSSRVDSRTILDQSGAEQLLGAGDMLYLPIGSGVPTRVHGAFVDDNEVHRVVSALKKNAKPSQQPALWSTEPQEASNSTSDAETDDELYDQAVAWVQDNQRVSISALQRRFRIGYNRAARLVESMESAGVVGPMNGSGIRNVLTTGHETA